jgi:hypothetical protein
MQHGLSTFVRLVRALLGPTAIADAKTEYGQAIVILGIKASRFTLSLALCLLATALWQVKSDSKGAWFHVCPKKAEKWASQLGDAIEALHLDSGSAQKLAG